MSANKLEPNSSAELLSINIVQINIIPSVAAIHHVIDRSRIIDPNLAWHENQMAD
jgi:hypothetical protein